MTTCVPSTGSVYEHPTGTYWYFGDLEPDGFMPAGTKVRVTGLRKGGGVSLEVVDSDWPSYTLAERSLRVSGTAFLNNFVPVT